MPCPESTAWMARHRGEAVRTPTEAGAFTSTSFSTAPPNRIRNRRPAGAGPRAVRQGGRRDVRHAPARLLRRPQGRQRPPDPPPGRQPKQASGNATASAATAAAKKPAAKKRIRPEPKKDLTGLTKADRPVQEGRHGQRPRPLPDDPRGPRRSTDHPQAMGSSRSGSGRPGGRSGPSHVVATAPSAPHPGAEGNRSDGGCARCATAPAAYHPA